MDRAYLLQHGRYDDGDAADVRVIGVYSSRSAAQAAIERLKEQPGFRDFPDAFTIDEYRLDDDNWADGFEGRTRRIDVPWWGYMGPIVLLGTLVYGALSGRWIDIPFVLGMALLFFTVAEVARRRAARIDYSQH